MISSLHIRRTLPLIFLILAASCASRQAPPEQEPADVEYANSANAARLAFETGDIQRAKTLYTQTLTRARATNASDLIVDAACNLAVCEIARKHFAAADALLREAEYDARRASANLDEIHLLQAKTAYLQNHLPESAKLASEVVGAKADATLRLAAMILKGQISCDGGDVATAKAQWEMIGKLTAAVRKPLSASVRADLAKLRGTIALLERDDVAAARYFDNEAELLETSRRYGDMSHALARAAESYLAAKRPGLAADRYFLAARSLAAQEEVAHDASSDAKVDIKVARQWLASSIAAAEKAGDAASKSRSIALMKEFTEAAGPSGETSPLPPVP